MIKASALRIGNIVECSGEVYTVNGIPDSNTVLLYGWPYKEPPVSISPVPLSEEWLKNLGFEMRMINGLVPEWYIMCTPPNYRRDFALVFRFGMLKSTAKGVCDEQRWHAWMDSGDSHNFNIKSIHQLQNLYHAITGEELQIKSV